MVEKLKAKELFEIRKTRAQTNISWRERAKNTAFGVAELKKTEHHKLFLQMGTYSSKKPMLPEANKGASASHFTWFYPGCYFSEAKPGFNSLQGTQIGQESGLPVTPIRSIPHSIEPADNVDTGSKPAKVKKRKPSTKGSNEISSKATRPKQSKRKKGPSFPAAKREKKDLNIDMDPSFFDFSGVPSPICSCTGVTRVCYKWGAGGWQSSCCTISISEYPLPMSTSRPGSRMAGRKMSNGAYGKLLLRLASEGYDLSYPVDLKEHWARHGTNKFVTIK